MGLMIRAPASLIAKLLPAPYEDDGLLVVVKPAGIDVGGLPEKASAGLVELLAELFPQRERLTPINRLSRYESGLLLLAKDPQMAARLRAAWKAGAVEQEYVAVVRGRMSKPTLVLGKAREERPATGSRRPPAKAHRPAKPFARREAPDENATVLRRLAQGEQRSLVQCTTKAATTHALRAQLRSAGLRLLGDKLHDRSPRPAADRDTRLHLARARVAVHEGQRPVLLQCDPPKAFQAALTGERDFERALIAALVRRLAVLGEHNTDCCRLLSGAVEDLPGLVVEKFGDVLVFQLFDANPRLMQSLRGVADWYRGMLGTKSVYVKRFVKARTAGDRELEESLRSPRPFFGEPAKERVIVQERGVRFVIRPYDGFSVGLFLDHRDNRSRIRELARDKDVLNLFAYTCGFSVCAALGGAQQTVSVDVAPKHLDWGRENFAANHIILDPAREGDREREGEAPAEPVGLVTSFQFPVARCEAPAEPRHPGPHLFFKSDAQEFLARARRQNRTFDLIILDPPSFAYGRSKKGDFSILTDLPALVASAAEVLRPHGVMMVSTNHRKMSHRDLRTRIAEGLAGRNFEIIATPPLPDFAMDPHHAKTAYVNVR